MPRTRTIDTDKALELRAIGLTWDAIGRRLNATASGVTRACERARWQKERGVSLILPCDEQAPKNAALELPEGV